jgi:hypothetical protein
MLAVGLSGGLDSNLGGFHVDIDWELSPLVKLLKAT